jgi:hypothetical protein
MKKDPSGYWQEVLKGGPGSGSWDGPGQPRGSQEVGGKDEPKLVKNSKELPEPGKPFIGMVGRAGEYSANRIATTLVELNEKQRGNSKFRKFEMSETASGRIAFTNSLLSTRNAVENPHIRLFAFSDSKGNPKVNEEFSVRFAR